MKNVFRGLSAKLALALLAVGTMTSCYEKEELDKTPAPTPEPAKYYIQGNVLDVENGQPLNATVTVDGATVTVNNGYYRTEVAADKVADGKEITIVADMDNYFKATKTAYLPKADAGSVTIATVDFALVGVNSQITAPEYNTPANKDQAKKLAEDSDLIGMFTACGLPDGTIEVDANGDVVVTAAKIVETEVGGNLTFKVPLMSGFSSTVSPAETKALTVGEIWLTSAAKALGIPYGMELVEKSHTFSGVQFKAISTLTIKAYYKARALAFNGKEGVVLYQEKVRATVIYEDHDSHDGHDWHDVHDSHDFTNPGAGGGSSAGE